MAKRNVRYFSHDTNASHDPDLVRVRMTHDLAGLGLYWLIIEYAHIEDIGVNDIEVLSYALRADKEIIKSILTDFDLFRVENGYYISDRVLRNLAEQEAKSKKAKRAVESRWKNNAPKETEAENSICPDDVFVAEVLQIFKDCFKNAQMVSVENKQKIADISTQNKLKIEDWELIFSNAKRGWEYPDGKKVKPSLKKVLTDWDSFLRADNGLAPDTERIAAEKASKEAAKKAEEEKLKAEADRQWNERQQRKENLSNKDEAIEFYLEHNRSMPKHMIARSSLFQELSQKFDFAVEDVLTARGEDA